MECLGNGTHLNQRKEHQFSQLGPTVGVVNGHPLTSKGLSIDTPGPGVLEYFPRLTHYPSAESTGDLVFCTNHGICVFLLAGQDHHVRKLTDLKRPCILSSNAPSLGSILKRPSASKPPAKIEGGRIRQQRMSTAELFPNVLAGARVMDVGEVHLCPLVLKRSVR